jgi:deoxyuridine 5'-triphosphate nucleotidohydrolase
MSDTIKFLKTREVKSPTRVNQTDAGIDFYVPEFTLEFLKDLFNKNPQLKDLKMMNLLEDKELILLPQQRILIPSGIHCQMFDNDRALIAFNKSGVSSKLGLVVGACVVDFDYQGEIHLNLINTGNEDVKIFAGMKILQFIETPVFNSDIIVEENKTNKEFYEKETSRGQSGFGDSGQ